MKDFIGAVALLFLMVWFLKEVFKEPTKVSTLCSLKHEAYIFNFNELKRNKELDLVCLCKGG